jgi:hypothetical protein
MLDWYDVISKTRTIIDGEWSPNTFTYVPWSCPDCGEDEYHPEFRGCRCPNLMYIPPGQHIHVDCPRHGKFKMYGQQIVYC